MFGLVKELQRQTEPVHGAQCLQYCYQLSAICVTVFTIQHANHLAKQTKRYLAAEYPPQLLAAYAKHEAITVCRGSQHILPDF